MGTYSAKEARDRTIDSVGTSAVFDRRARDYKLRLRLLDFVGMAVPLGVGSLMLGGIQTNGLASKGLAVVLTVQVLAFAWALIANWGDALDQAIEARTTNREQGEQYRRFITQQPLGGEWEVLEVQRLNQDRIDEKAGVKQSEKRYGMRYALKQEQFPCAECKEVPSSLGPSKCHTCGRFPKHWGR